MTTKAYEIGQFGISLVVTDAGEISALSINTTQVTEGNNLYFTNARARGAISASGSLAYNSTTGALTYTQGNTDTITEGTTNKYYTDTRVGTYLSTNSYATQSYVTTAISNVIDGAPTALNTLNELAAALNDDASFASTVTTALGTIPTSVSQLTNDTGFITSQLSAALRTNGNTITGGNYDGSYVSFVVGAGAVIGSTYDGNVYVQTGTGGTVAKTWQYKSNGELLFPDATTQTTAWTGSVADGSIGVSKFNSTVANTYSTKGTSIAMAIALG
jgi:hypothetical protein